MTITASSLLLKIATRAREHEVCDVVVAALPAWLQPLALVSRGRLACFVDRERHLGGVMKQCIHDGFGLQRFGQELPGPEFAAKELVDVRAQGVEILGETTVLRVDSTGVSGGLHTVVAVNAAGEHFHRLARRRLGDGFARAARAR